MMRVGLYLLALAAPLAWALHGSMQPALDLWMKGRLKEARAAFAAESGSALAALNGLIVDSRRLDQEQAGAEQWRQLAERFAALPAATPSFARLYHESRCRLQAGDTSAALPLLEQAVDLKPEVQYSARLLLGVLDRLRDPRLEPWGVRLIEKRPDNSWLYLHRARGLLREGRLDQALQTWRQGIDVYPLRPMLEEAIAAAGPARPALSRRWLEVLGHRYHHVYNDRSLQEYARRHGVEHLLGGLPTIRERRERMRENFARFFPPGREWEYAVSFGFIPLGTLIVGVEGAELTLPDGMPVYRVYYKIDSNPIYRWLIDLHDEYSSLIPGHCLHSLEFNLDSVEGNERYESRYTSDFEAGRLLVHGYKADGVIHYQQLPLAQEVFDGLSLLFAARRQVQEERYGSVLTIIDEEMHRTIIEPDGRDRIRSLGQRVPVRKVHGLADYQGIAGLTGEFWGTFSDDERSLPLEAKFQIGVGRISLRLKEIRDG